MVKRNLGEAQTVLVKKPLAFDGNGEGEGGDEGTPAAKGGGEGNLNIAELMQNPDVQAAIKAQIDAEVVGLKSKNSELLDKYKKTQESAKKFEGLDVERLTNLQKQLDENEEMQLLADGKVEQVVERRTELLKKDYQQQIDMREVKLQEYEGIVKQKDEKLRELVIDGTVREAYVSLDFEPTAMADTIRNARDIFILGDDGKVIPRDDKGNVIFSKDGKTPIDAKGWLETQVERKPYLKRLSKGGGAIGNKGGSTHDATTSVGKIANGLKQLGY